MEENLVGYLLNALDAPTQREVEDYLREHPEARARLELLRRALAPLAADRGSEDQAPAGLRHAALGRVAAYRCRDLPQAPLPPSSRAIVPLRTRWRRPDALVAAAILLVALPLVASLALRLRHEYHVTACKNNLSAYHRAFIIFADLHNGYLPQVREKPPEHVAGIFVPLLNDRRLLGAGMSIACPSNGRHGPAPQSVPELRDLYELHRSEFDRLARSMGGCYAYALGYRDENRTLHGLHRETHTDQYPVMADRPPFDQTNPTGLDRNSTNHGGKGQNVLFLGGHVTFATTRHVGIERDDIYLNRRRELDAGLHAKDSVLASSAVRVTPAIPFPD